MFMLLDLSAAFDSVNDSILLDQLVVGAGDWRLSTVLALFLPW